MKNIELERNLRNMESTNSGLVRVLSNVAQDIAVQIDNTDKEDAEDKENNMAKQLAVVTTVYSRVLTTGFVNMIMMTKEPGDTLHRECAEDYCYKGLENAIKQIREEVSEYIAELLNMTEEAMEKHMHK